MIALCWERFPKTGGITASYDFQVGDASALIGCAEESCDVVLFSCNGIDCLAGEGRARCLREVRRVLRPGGMFLFSAHNLQAVETLYAEGSAMAATLSPERRARVKAKNPPLESWRGMDEALVWDGVYGPEVELRHVYVRPGAQAAWLAESGFAEVEVISTETGRVLPAAEAAENRRGGAAFSVSKIVSEIRIYLERYFCLVRRAVGAGLRGGLAEGGAALGDEGGAFVERVEEFFFFDRFAEEGIHAGGEAGGFVVGEDGGGEGDDPGLFAFGEEFADFAGGLEAVHFGHVHVHEDEVEAAGFGGGDGFEAVVGDVGFDADFAEDGGGDFLVHEVVSARRTRSEEKAARGMGERGGGVFGFRGGVAEELGGEAGELGLRTGLLRTPRRGGRRVRAWGR